MPKAKVKLPPKVKAEIPPVRLEPADRTLAEAERRYKAEQRALARYLKQLKGKS